MKTALFILFSLLAIQVPAALTIGSSIPSSTAKLLGSDGKDVSISAVKGAKGTLVIFSCNHCPYAKAWESRIAEIGKDAVSKGVGVIMINANDPAVNKEDSIEVMKTKTFAFPYAVDPTSDVARAFGAEKTPDIFLFDGGGKLVYKGAVDDNSEDASKVKTHFLKDAIKNLAAGKKIAMAETKAIGCSIKFRKK